MLDQPLDFVKRGRFPSRLDRWLWMVRGGFPILCREPKGKTKHHSATPQFDLSFVVGLQPYRSSFSSPPNPWKWSLECWWGCHADFLCICSRTWIFVEWCLPEFRTGFTKTLWREQVIDANPNHRHFLRKHIWEMLWMGILTGKNLCLKIPIRLSKLSILEVWCLQSQGNQISRRTWEATVPGQRAAPQFFESPSLNFQNIEGMSWISMSMYIVSWNWEDRWMVPFCLVGKPL